MYSPKPVEATKFEEPVFYFFNKLFFDQPKVTKEGFQALNGVERTFVSEILNKIDGLLKQQGFTESFMSDGFSAVNLGDSHSVTLEESHLEGLYKRISMSQTAPSPWDRFVSAYDSGIRSDALLTSVTSVMSQLRTLSENKGQDGEQKEIVLTDLINDLEEKLKPSDLDAHAKNVMMADFRNKLRFVDNNKKQQALMRLRGSTNKDQNNAAVARARQEIIKILSESTRVKA